MPLWLIFVRFRVWEGESDGLEVQARTGGSEETVDLVALCFHPSSKEVEHRKLERDLEQVSVRWSSTGDAFDEVEVHQVTSSALDDDHFHSRATDDDVDYVVGPPPAGDPELFSSSSSSSASSI